MARVRPTFAALVCTVAILLVAKPLYAIITPVLGGSILVGIIAHALRLRAPETEAVRMRAPEAGSVR